MMCRNGKKLTVIDKIFVQVYNKKQYFGGDKMPQILETVMLVCFGFSWPINLIKNIRAKTAKSTSLFFIILITLGYIAGIAAKIISGQINYVLIAYFINIIFVLMNLAVYFINRKHDKNSCE
jgi:hypothetical protein